eukprot:487630-Pelagomonas_calceolata.AAC.11
MENIGARLSKGGGGDTHAQPRTTICTTAPSAAFFVCCMQSEHIAMRDDSYWINVQCHSKAQPCASPQSSQHSKTIIVAWKRGAYTALAQPPPLTKIPTSTGHALACLHPSRPRTYATAMQRRAPWSACLCPAWAILGHSICWALATAAVAAVAAAAEPLTAPQQQRGSVGSAASAGSGGSQRFVNGGEHQRVGRRSGLGSWLPLSLHAYGHRGQSL